jgi:MFS family permease
VLFFGVGTLASSALVLGLAQDYAMLLAAAAIAGLGNSIFHPADFTLLNRKVSAPRLGHAFSVHGLTGNLGWAAAPVFMAGIAAAAGWQAAAFAAAALGFAVLGLLVLRRHSLDEHETAAAVGRGEAAGGTDGTGAGQLAFLRVGAVWVCFMFFFFSTGALSILQNYGPAVLGKAYGLSLVLATAGLTAYLLGSAAGMVAGGFIAARRGDSDRVIAAALGASATVALLLAAGWMPGWMVLPLMAAMGFGVGCAGPSRDLLVRKAAMTRFGKTSYGRVYGFVYSGLDVGFAAVPLVVGPMLDAGQYNLALVGVALMQVAALLGALRVGQGVRAAPGAAVAS